MTDLYYANPRCKKQGWHSEGTFPGVYEDKEDGTMEFKTKSAEIAGLDYYWWDPRYHTDPIFLPIPKRKNGSGIKGSGKR